MQETNMVPFDQKIENAYTRLEAIENEFKCLGENVYVAHSGGKDSVVVHHLACRVFGPKINVIHTPKVSGFNKVHPETVHFLYETAAAFNMTMVRGDDMKRHLIMNDLFVQIDGTRRDEADRTDRSSNVVVDGKDVSRTEMTWKTDDGLFGQACVFPIYDWSDDDVWKYIRAFSVPYSKEYNLSTPR